MKLHFTISFNDLNEDKKNEIVKVLKEAVKENWIRLTQDELKEDELENEVLSIADKSWTELEVEL